MMPINGAGQDNFALKLGELINKTNQKIEEQQVQPMPVSMAEPVRTEQETANIAYGQTLNALENGQQTPQQTGHALDPARVAALLDL